MALPTKLIDVFEATPYTDSYGNKLYSNWSVHFPPFNYSANNPASLALHEMGQGEAYSDILKNYFYAKDSYSWSSLYDMVNSIMESVSKPEKPNSLIRHAILGLNGGGGDIGSEISNTIPEYRSLLTIVVIALIFSIIIMPIVSILVFCLVRRHYRNSYGYTPYSPPSITSAYVLPLRPLNIARAVSPYEPPAYDLRRPVGLIVMAIIIILTGLAAIFGIGAAFYFNDRFSQLLGRAFGLTDGIPHEINMTVSNYMNELETFGAALAKDMDRKNEFSKRALSSLERIKDDTPKVESLVKKSSADSLFLSLLLWEFTVVNPLSQSLDSSQEATSSLCTLHASATSFFDGMNIDNWDDTRQSLCTNYDTTKKCGYNPIQSLTTIPPNPNTCYSCAVPLLPETVDPFSAPLPSREQQDGYMKALVTWKNKWKSRKLISMVSRDMLLQQIGEMPLVIMEDFSKWIAYYSDWFDKNVKSLTSGQCRPPENVTTTPSPTTTTTTTTAKSTTTKQPVTSPTTTKPPSTTTQAPPPAAEQAPIDVRGVFEDWRIVVATLLAIALAGIIIMISGSVCLLVVYFRNSYDFQPNFRAEKPTGLEKIGRSLLVGGAVIFVVLAGPLLTIAASGQFLVSGLADDLVCKVIRTKNYTAIENTLNKDVNGGGSNIVANVLPKCLVAFVDSMDKAILAERLTVGKFLRAADDDKTVNQLLQLDNTSFIREVRNVTTMAVRTKFTIYSTDMDFYMKNMSGITASRSVFQLLIDNVNVTTARQLYATLRTCTNCVLSSFPKSPNNSSRANSTTPQGPDLSKLLREATGYQAALIDYAVTLPSASESWFDSVQTIEESNNGKRDTLGKVNFTETYFRMVPFLFKDEIRYFMTMMIDNMFASFTENVAHMRPLWILYDVIIRDFACIQTTGAMNSVWLFIGIYLFFAAIATLLIFVTVGVLSGLKRDLPGDDHDYWETQGKFGNLNPAWSMVPVTGTYNSSTSTNNGNLGGGNANPGYVDNEAYHMGANNQQQQQQLNCGLASDDDDDDDGSVHNERSVDGEINEDNYNRITTTSFSAPSGPQKHVKF